MASKGPRPVLPTLPPGFLRNEHSLDESEHEQEYHRPECRTNQGPDESVKGQPQEAEQKAPDEGAYDTYDHIDYQTGPSASCNLFGNKTGDKSYYQEPNQWLYWHIDSHVFLLRQLVEKQFSVREFTHACPTSAARRPVIIFSLFHKAIVSCRPVD
jgi:hypothetical protein